jgi:hypothetical protein
VADLSRFLFDGLRPLQPRSGPLRLGYELQGAVMLEANHGEIPSVDRDDGAGVFSLDEEVKAGVGQWNG